MKPLLWWGKWESAPLHCIPGGKGKCSLREGWKDKELTCLQVSFSPCKQCRKPPPVITSQQRLHIIRFLQKLGCQKPCRDQARLSSHVNRQAGPIWAIWTFPQTYLSCKAFLSWRSEKSIGATIIFSHEVISLDLKILHLSQAIFGLPLLKLYSSRAELTFCWKK